MPIPLFHNPIKNPPRPTASAAQDIMMKGAVGWLFWTFILCLSRRIKLDWVGDRLFPIRVKPLPNQYFTPKWKILINSGASLAPWLRAEAGGRCSAENETQESRSLLSVRFADLTEDQQTPTRNRGARRVSVNTTASNAFVLIVRRIFKTMKKRIRIPGFHRRLEVIIRSRPSEGLF